MIWLARVAAISAVAALAGCNSGSDNQSADPAVPADGVAVASAPAPDKASEAPQQNDQSGVDCVDQQATIFSCTLSDGSLLRVCQANGSAQYRFGPANGPAEITLPRTPGGDWAWASVPYSGGGEAQARFANGQFDYIVYSRVVRTRFDGNGNEPEITDGVIVRQNGAIIANRRCDPAIVRALDVNALQALQPGQSELFAYVDEE